MHYLPENTSLFGKISKMTPLITACCLFVAIYNTSGDVVEKTIVASKNDTTTNKIV